MKTIRTYIAFAISLGIRAGAIWAAFFGGPQGFLNVAAVATWLATTIMIASLAAILKWPEVLAEVALQPKRPVMAFVGRISSTGATVALLWAGFIATGVVAIIGTLLSLSLLWLANRMRNEFSLEDLRAIVAEAKKR